MAQISTVLALLDPINGTDPPVPDIDAQIENGIPFKTLDYLYEGFRTLHPPETLIVLSVNVLLGTVFMQLTDIKYELLIISNPNNNAVLIIRGKVGKSVQIGSVSFDINTEIRAPYQPYQVGVTDVPVIISSDFYIIEGGYLSILSDNPIDLSVTRDIIRSDGFLITKNMDYLNSVIDINIPESTIFVVNFLCDILVHFEINCNLFSHYVALNTGDIDTIRATIQTIRSTVNYKSPPPSLVSSKTLQSKCDDFLAFVFDGKEVSNPGWRLGIATALTVGTLPLALAISWGFYKLANCPSAVPSASLKNKDRRIQELKKDKFSLFLGEYVQLLQQIEGPVTFEGPGTIEVNTEGSGGSSGLPFLTNTDSVILNLNLVDIKPFLSDSDMIISDYNLIQDNDSYNNSGSIFRRPKLITSNYTLTQFDGEVFLINASLGDITVTIPIGDVSKNRLMEFKRIDDTKHTVVIVSPGGIDKYKSYPLNVKICKDGCKSRKLPYVRLFGDGTKVWIMS